MLYVYVVCISLCFEVDTIHDITTCLFLRAAFYTDQIETPVRTGVRHAASRGRLRRFGLFVPGVGMAALPLSVRMVA